MNLQRNIAKHKHTHTHKNKNNNNNKKTVLGLSLLLLVKTCCNSSLLSCPSMQQNSAVHFKDVIGFRMLSSLYPRRLGRGEL
ncbi:RIKEN cDNA 1700025G04, isoform CRA_a [Mus musculus]|nr:RIKEN cDNA 1700025G04, isoform CRA_a [Mus musculus]